MSQKYYKGFNKDLQCTPNGEPFQYEIGKTYETDEADLCKSGFHACEAPLDVLRYYEPGKGSRYCEVELDGVSDQREYDTKVCAKKITVGAEIGIPGLVKAHVEWVKERATEKVEKGDAEAATAGDGGAATAGYRGAATAGDGGAATAGECGAATAGYRGVATAGDRGAATAGYRGAATSRGKSSVGENGAAIARGNGTKVKGGLGAVLILVEENTSDYHIKFWEAFLIDGKRYKPDTWYTLDKNGKVVKAEENNKNE